MTIYMSPYRRMAALRESMERAMDDAITQRPTNEREMILAVDVRGDDEAFTINAFVPGMDADDLSIEILNNTVTIRGEFKPLADEEVKYLTSELPEGHFYRLISLPVDVDSTKAEANIKNGVLTLRIPKAEAHRPKTIKINVN